ncbi:hypothetical protein ACI2JA_19645 [Alkalihalobacillus sp. NPDC078783]|uniref:hypothetical protein n=1 Tax=Streptomyces albidoflavus TaxID=1886 RepID=UPI0033C94881
MSLVADVFEMVIIDKLGNVIAKDVLSESNITKETAENEVRAGRGNNIYAILNGDTNIEISSTTPVFNLENLALHVGTEIVTGKGTAFASFEHVTVQEGDDSLSYVTLKHAPISEKYLSIVDKDGQQIPKANMLLSGKEVQFSSGVQVGEDLKVLTYEYETSEDTKQLDINIDQFPKDVRIVLTTLKLNQDSQPVSELQFDFPRVKPSANFAINTGSEREASPQEANFKVLLNPNTKKLGTIKEIPLT